MKRPTIADIARRAGVSKGAVSYALNGRPGVSEATRARILAIAKELGWRPSLAARALTGARAHAIGLVLCRPARVLGMEPFLMELISGIEAELSARSYALLLRVVSDHRAELAVHRRWWGEGRVDGAFLVDLHVDDPRVPEIEMLGMPAVVIGHPSAAGSLVPVWSDDGAAVEETVAYLAALGHRRIARVAGLPRLVHTVIRDRAFEETCRRLGMTERSIRKEFRVILIGYGSRKIRPVPDHGHSAKSTTPDDDVMRSPGRSGIRKEEEQRGCTEKTVWVNPRLFENAKKNLPKGVTISTAVELILNAQREGKITSTDPGKIKERSQVASIYLYNPDNHKVCASQIAKIIHSIGSGLLGVRLEVENCKKN